MRPATATAGFVAGLVAVFAAALAVGSQLDAVGEPVAPQMSGHDAADDTAGMSGMDDAQGVSGIVPGGLMVSESGYTLTLDRSSIAAGRHRQIGFVITGPDGRPAIDYEVEHGKELHLIVVRRDFTRFQHVHPTRDADGTWTARVDLVPGQWRVFADFVPAGADSLTLGADLVVPGDLERPATLPISRTDTVDGYTVTLDGDLVAGEHSMLTLSVSKNGKPVADLQPYLGAYGHLVSLREGDLAYLHVHPDGEPGDGETSPGPDVVFGAEVPSVARYHLYLNFKHDGVVRTAQFTVDAGGPAEDR